MALHSTGLRQGELIGLQWGDLDLQRGKLHVRRTIWRGVTGLPKGGRERTVDLLGSALEALKAHRHLRGPYVFCQADGQPHTNGAPTPSASPIDVLEQKEAEPALGSARTR